MVFKKFTTAVAISALLITGVGPALGQNSIADQTVAQEQFAGEQMPLPAAGAATVEEAQLTQGQWIWAGAIGAGLIIACVFWWCDGSSSSSSSPPPSTPPPPPSGTN